MIGIKKLIIFSSLLLLILFCIPLFGIVISIFKSHFDNLAYIVTPDTIKIIFFSIFISFLTTIICIFFGYVVAYMLYTIKIKKYHLILFMIGAPLLLNSLIKVLVIKEIFIPLNFTGTDGSLLVGFTYFYISYAIIFIYYGLKEIDKYIILSGNDLGASKIQNFIYILFPLTKKHIKSAAYVIFLPCTSTIIISKYLGEGQKNMIGNKIIEIFSGNSNSLQNVFIVSVLSLLFCFAILIIFKILLSINYVKFLWKR